MAGIKPSHIISLALITISLVVAISFGITTAISVANTYGILEQIINVDNFNTDSFLEEIVFSFDIGSVLLALSIVLVSVLFVLYTRG